MRPLAALTLVLALPAVAAQTGLGPVEVSAEGKLHVDARAFPGGPVGDSPGFLVRRARVELTAETAGGVRAVLEPGFGEGEVEIIDGYVEAALWGGSGAPHALAVRAGRFKTPVGYESLRSSSDLRFAERALPTALSPRRDLGVQLAWEAPRVEAQAGLFNGVPDGASGSDDWGSGPDAAARVFARPGGRLDGLGLGLAVAAGTERGTADTPGLDDYETSGDRTVFGYAPGVRAGGGRLRLAPQATLDLGRLSLLGEWTLARHRLDTPLGAATVEHRAWQAAASVVAVGVPQGDGRPVPRRSVAEGGRGAVEVSARVHGLMMDERAEPLAEDGSTRRATAAGLAVHWTPVAEARLGVTVERTVFDGFGLDEPPAAETFVVVRAQLDL